MNKKTKNQSRPGGTKTKNCFGFTLVELLVVISLIGILASILIASFAGVSQKARDGQRKSDLRQLQGALEIYRSDQGQYPDGTATYPYPTTCGSALLFTPAGGSAVTYIQSISCDPLTRAMYTYTAPTGGATYTLVACLENASDPDRDSVHGLPNTCTGGKQSFTIKNP